MRKGSLLHRLLSRIYWWYHHRWEETLERKRLRLLRKSLLKPRGRKVYLIGTPTHENLGDSAIVLAQKSFLQNNGWQQTHIIEITDAQYRQDWNNFCKWIPKNALIAQLGGGHMGNQWPNEELLHRQQVQAFTKNPSVIFPQTIYYHPDGALEMTAAESVAIYNGKANLTIAAREKSSYETMRAMYPDTKILLVPDIVLSSSMQTYGAKPQKRKGAILCFRNDKEKALSDQTHAAVESILYHHGIVFRSTDMYSDQVVSPENREQLVRNKLEELSSAEIVITDRLHGMVFCALTGTPCVVFGNNNPKVRGTYDWISYLPYIRYAKSVAEMEAYLPQLMVMKENIYDSKPLQQYYAELAEVVKKYASY